MLFKLTCILLFFIFMNLSHRLNDSLVIILSDILSDNAKSTDVLIFIINVINELENGESLI